MANQRTDLQGRQVIYTDFAEVTKDNVVEIINKAKGIHEKNSTDIDYLYNYYKGQQPILQRTKDFNDNVLNKIVTNIANEIVSFKVGYLMGEPVQYINQADDQFSKTVSLLNDYMRYEDKEAKDKSLVTWNTICGTAYRMILPDPVGEEDEAPFEIYTLDPRNTFVVYHSGLGNKCLMGVTILNTEEGQKKYVGYTDSFAFEILDGNVEVWQPHILHTVPIIEYPANEARLGAFEIVLPLLDAINTIQSNRVDGIEQLIQAMLILKGTDLSDEDFKQAKALGGLKIPADGDAFFISTVLNQTETQTLVDYTYQSVLTICGMPNRNGGSSTSDTGSAVIYRDGWFSAEARAKEQAERDSKIQAMVITDDMLEEANELLQASSEIKDFIDSAV